MDQQNFYFDKQGNEERVVVSGAEEWYLMCDELYTAARTMCLTAPESEALINTFTTCSTQGNSPAPGGGGGGPGGWGGGRPTRPWGGGGPGGGPRG